MGTVTGTGFDPNVSNEAVFAVEGPFGAPGDTYTFLAGIANEDEAGGGYDLSGTGLAVGFDVCSIHGR